MAARPIAPPAVVAGQGLPVILLHAFPLDGRMWMPVADALAADYQVIVPDLRGFGKARRQLDSLREIPIDLAADDIAALMDARQLQQAVLGGISRGGYIALAFARRFPERLRALMLFDTRANPADPKERETYLDMADRVRQEGIAFVPEMMRPRFFSSATLRSNPSLVEEVNAIILSQDPDAIAAAALGMVHRSDARPSLSELTLPTLAVAGTDDGAFQNTKDIADAIPGARFVPIDRASHLPPLERPETVAAAMRDFLNRAIG